MADHLQPGRDLLQHFRHVLAEAGQAGGIGAAAAAGQDRLMQDGLARQVLGQRASHRRLPRRVGLAPGPARLSRRSIALRLVLFEIADQHLELADLGRQPFGGLAEAFAPQRRELGLELLDLASGVQQMGVTLREGRIALCQSGVAPGDDGVAFRQQHAQVRGVVGECSAVEIGGHARIVADRAASPQMRMALSDDFRPCRPGRHAPIDSFEQHGKHGRCEGDNAARRLRPHEPASLKPLGDEHQALAVPEQNLQQIAAAPAKAEYRAAVRILREHGPHLRRQTVEALSHVRRTAGQVHPRAGRWAEHQRPRSSANTPRSAAMSTLPLTRSVVPAGKLTSMTPGVSVAVAGADTGASSRDTSGTTSTGTRPDIAVANISRRQVNSSPVPMPCRSATTLATAPGANVSRTIRSLSSVDQFRRRTARTRTSTPEPAPRRIELLRTS
jgi:hypothetical protein